MMKSKLMAGIMATVISLVLVVVVAIILVSMDINAGNDRFTKMIAFGVIAIWLGLFALLKPKNTEANKDADNKPQA